MTPKNVRFFGVSPFRVKRQNNTWATVKRWNMKCRLLICLWLWSFVSGVFKLAKMHGWFGTANLLVPAVSGTVKGWHCTPQHLSCGVAVVGDCAENWLLRRISKCSSSINHYQVLNRQAVYCSYGKGSTRLATETMVCVCVWVWMCVCVNVCLFLYMYLPACLPASLSLSLSESLSSHPVPVLAFRPHWCMGWLVWERTSAAYLKSTWRPMWVRREIGPGAQVAGINTVICGTRWVTRCRNSTFMWTRPVPESREWRVL